MSEKNSALISSLAKAEIEAILGLLEFVTNALKNQIPVEIYAEIINVLETIKGLVQEAS